MIARLVTPKSEDADELYQLIDANRLSLRNMKWAATATLESTEDFIKERLRATSLAAGESFYLIRDRWTSYLVGCITLRSTAYRQAEIGYWIGSEHRNMGFAQSAVNEILRIQGQFVDKVTARVRESNQASRKILGKTGFRQISRVNIEGELWELWVSDLC